MKVRVSLSHVKRNDEQDDKMDLLVEKWKRDRNTIVLKQITCKIGVSGQKELKWKNSTD